MRTMKRVAAVALSVVVLMTSGVSAKAAVTDVQPAKSKEEAVEKWVNKLMPDGVYDTLSEIKVVGNYIYAAEDSNHRIIKINKENGKIEKEHSYYKADYKQYYVGNIGYGDGKVYVSYATQGTNTVGRIEAFNADTLEPVWISEIASHNERSTEGAPYLVVNDVVASKLFYDNGHLYFGTGAGTPGSSYGWDKIGKYYVLDTADEDKNKTDEIKKIKEIASASTEGNFYLKDGIKVGNYIITSDTKGKLFVIDSNTFKVVATKEMNEVFSGGMAYDNTTNTIYFVAGINNLYGIKINTDGSFGETKKVQVYKTKVYLTGSKGTDGIENTGYFAVVDVKSDEYKVNYTVDIPAYSLGEMLVVKTGSDSVRLYFAVNYAKFDENSKALSGGNVYCVDDKQGATSGELKTIYEPDKDHVQLCMNTIHVDEKGTLYYINDSRSIFAIGKKAASITPSTSNATIPMNIDTLAEKMGVSKKISSFTIPLGATINMDGTSIMQGVAVVFTAQAFGIHLSMMDYATVIGTATLASIGTAGVPSVGLITLTMVFNSVGLPVEGIALIMGIDRILDMTRTAVNITGDAVCTTVVASMNKAVDRDIYYGRK